MAIRKIKGTNRDDRLFGTDGDDRILTLRGNDEAHGGAGDDVIAGNVNVVGAPLFGGATVIDTDKNHGDGYKVVGGDKLYGDAGNDTIYVGYDTFADGGADTDTAVVELVEMYVPWVAHTILTTFNDEGVDVDLADGRVVLGIGGLGDMTITLENFERFNITFGSGDDRAFGAALGDTLYGGYNGNDEFHGRGGDDRLYGEADSDNLFGDEGNDILEAGGSNTLFFEDYAIDHLYGGTGKDELYGGRGDSFDGGGGYDRATINLASSRFSYTLNLDTLVSATPFNFGDGHEDPDFVHNGTSTANLENLIALLLGSGNDTLTGSVAAFGDYGTNSFAAHGLYLGAGDDVVHLTGRLDDDGDAPVFGEGGNDRITLDGDYGRLFNLGYDTVNGFETIALAAGNDYNLTTIIGFDGRLIDGSALDQNDRLSLVNEEDRALTVIGGAGDDVISSAMRADTLVGGGGDDTLSGGKGDDLIDGGIGIDTASYMNALRAVTIDLSITGAQDKSGDGTDTLISIENIIGSSHDDTLSGDDAANVLAGGDGKDVLGGDGGDDILVGGKGADVLRGGLGVDVFLVSDVSDSPRLAASDRIADFDRSQHDLLDLSGIDANNNSRADNAFTFIGDAAFTRHAGELRTYIDGNFTIVTGDVDGDGKGDVFLKLDGGQALEATDFIL